MPRRGTKVQVSVYVCQPCKKQAGTTYLNKATTPKLERNRYCPQCRKHTPQVTRGEKSGSLGLARNK